MTPGEVPILSMCSVACRKITEIGGAVWCRVELLSSLFDKILPHMISSEERGLNLTSHP